MKKSKGRHFNDEYRECMKIMTILVNNPMWDMWAHEFSKHYVEEISSAVSCYYP